MDPDENLRTAPSRALASNFETLGFLAGRSSCSWAAGKILELNGPYLPFVASVTKSYSSKQLLRLYLELFLGASLDLFFEAKKLEHKWLFGLMLFNGNLRTPQKSKDLL